MATTRPFAHKVVYQVYPKSFADSNGDGVGDLRGIINHVDHIASLGVDAVWMNPIYPSPGKDNGYDVADYTAIDPAMGTMADFEELVAALKAHNIDVMLDMVFNHCSDQHEWFRRALAGEAKYQDYFIIRDKDDITSWESKFGGPAWSPFGDTGRYYLHLFDPSQPDLNWRNPAVRQECANIVNFWRSKGVAGFRFDVINLIGKDEVLRDAPEGVDERDMYTDGEIVHDYLRELAARSFGRDDNHLTVGEMSHTSIAHCLAYTGAERGELDMTFSFYHLKADYVDDMKWTDGSFQPGKLIHILHAWNEGLSAGDGWPAWFLNNHDQPRALSRFGDPENYPFESASMLGALVVLNRGTPYVYMGEEIGMTNPDYAGVADLVDVESHNAYRILLSQGLDEDTVWRIVKAKSRDNSRSPMQWDDSEFAGFSTHYPWLLPTNQDSINVQAARALQERLAREGVRGQDEVGSPREVLGFYRALVDIRHREEVFAHGDYVAHQPDSDSVYAFIRQHRGTRMLVACNLTAEGQSLRLPEGFVGARVFLTNGAAHPAAGLVRLDPYQVIVYRAVDGLRG
ncbi:alpha,alpha-phosphotrehalase [Corynebacterium aquilae]|uniref:Alpha-amylase n=1 Tax=Corynebacterium aquilae DSM 44791 TaxID=1431546 RepID=A0A1L7CE70_9CORY|nr:alpha,alpha-phosphotrehalase [Corynebacterium aquilae]APT84149.1 alpha-amylase [Corynebacterium aquilae DSM 44791]